MSRTLNLWAICILAVCAANTAAAMPEGTVDTRKELISIGGEYEIRRDGEVVGKEAFMIEVFDDNTVVLVSSYNVVAPESVQVAGYNRLVLDEDSRFPREYESNRRMGEVRREVTAKMYANVVDLTRKVDDEVEEKQIVLPTGCLFLEGNIAIHLVELLYRYDKSLGGKQVFRSFDPLLARESEVGLEYAGEGVPGQEDPINVPPVSLYKFYAGNLPAIDVAVGGDGRVMSVLVGFQDVEYLLKKYEEVRADGG